MGAIVGRAGTSPLATVLMFTRPDISTRPTIASDAAFCRALFHETRRATFAALHLGDDPLMTLLDQQFRAQQTAYRQAFPDANDLMIEQHGIATGRLMTTMRDDATMHIVDILVSVDARGRGIGSLVIDSLGQTALACGAARLMLSVLVGNAGARRLYERLGFRATRNDGVRIFMLKQLDR